MIWAVSNIFWQKLYDIQKWTLHHWKENQKCSVAHGRSDVTPTMATRSETVDMDVKWWLKPRKCFVCSSSIPQNLWPLISGVFRGNAIKILHAQIQFESGIIDFKTPAVSAERKVPAIWVPEKKQLIVFGEPFCAVLKNQFIKLPMNCSTAVNIMKDSEEMSCPPSL
jgi:hypothetical protein